MFILDTRRLPTMSSSWWSLLIEKTRQRHRFGSNHSDLSTVSIVGRRIPNSPQLFSLFVSGWSIRAFGAILSTRTPREDGKAIRLDRKTEMAS